MEFPIIERKNVYARINHQNRVKLIELVQKDKLSIKKASKEIGIKYSTAKLIIKKYKETGTVTMFLSEKCSENRTTLIEQIVFQNLQVQQSVGIIQKEQNIIEEQPSFGEPGYYSLTINPFMWNYLFYFWNLSCTNSTLQEKSNFGWNFE